MAEQVFRSPGFFEREIELKAPPTGGPSGVPAGVIGMSNKGPAFVPVTVATFNEFVSIFGNLDPKKFGPYAVNEFLKNRTALTYMRVLGAGANKNSTDISSTSVTGRVKNAGFKLEGNVSAHDSKARHNGAVQFLVADHTLQTNEAYGMPMFTDNDSRTSATNVNLVRGVVMLASGARMMVLDGNESVPAAFIGATTVDDAAQVKSGKFKLIISSALGSTYAFDDKIPGVKIYTASMNPSNVDYFAKVLNRDPEKFEQYQHVLYSDFAVDDEVASVVNDDYVAVLSGSSLTSNVSGEPTTEFRKAFGAYDTRFSSPKTSYFISQPFGTTEYDLFQIESLDDGAYANSLYKVSISNLKVSENEAYEYGTFNVQIRDWNDTDINPSVIEEFVNCSLDPDSDNYIGKVIGDRKVTYDFDQDIVSERRIITSGKYDNVSKYVRVVISQDVEDKKVPAKSLPFGFRGPELLKTNDALTDGATSAKRLAGVFSVDAVGILSQSILPPVPFRFKVTKGPMTSPAWDGDPGPQEVASPQFYWGVKFERNDVPLNVNLSEVKNSLLESYTKFAGIKKLDVLVTGSGADTFNNNKFSLSKVAFSAGTIAGLTGTVRSHMKEAAYIRNAKVDPTAYTINDPTLGNRITFASLLSNGEPYEFNKYSSFAKFTTFMQGGFDGLNILDPAASRMNDKATSFETPLGGASSTFVSPGMLTNLAGVGVDNNAVNSYITAVDVMTDPLQVNVNLLALPGIREDYITNYTAKKVRDYGLSMYVMDLPNYDDNDGRIYDDSTNRINIENTAATFEARSFDNNYVAAYFPNVYVNDETNKRYVKVPSSVAALGALGFNDRVAYPWFAPAGFNRAALDFVNNVEVRLNVSDRDRLYDARINPIATFPRLGFVIYGQKTLQIRKSALDRVNVRRLLLEVKRLIINIANRIVFEQNTPAVRNKFVADSVLQLGLIQAQAGIEAYQVVMNETNNTQEDVDLNRLNGRIVVVPTRAIEFIAIDFIVTNAGVQFV
ncbi:MAG: hypothetical protein EBU90_05110 [Proteobacteria bacterium]|nr:hypothetical protein [Pseudomonadota bacterium]